jgi:threonine/homoserine/homoserine lactone efflux protein
MTTSPNDPQPNKAVQAVTAIIMLAGAIYLIYLGIQLFTL